MPHLLSHPSTCWIFLTKHSPLPISFLHWNFRRFYFFVQPSHIGWHTASALPYLAHRQQVLFLQEALKAARSQCQCVSVTRHRFSQPTLLISRLIALTSVFQLSQGQFLNIYTDSRYGVHILLSHPAIWKESRLFAAKGRSITYSDQIMTILKASHFPLTIRIVHCQSHQTDDFIISKGNNQVNEAAKAAALEAWDPSHPPQDILAS